MCNSAAVFLVFLPQFVKPENSAVGLQLSVLGVLFVLMGLASTIAVAFSAESMGAYLRKKPVITKWQGEFVGSINCALGVYVAMQER